MKVGMARHARALSINQHSPRWNRMAVGALCVSGCIWMLTVLGGVFPHNVLRIEGQASMGSGSPKPRRINLNLN